MIVFSAFIFIISLSFIVTLYLGIFVASRLYVHEHTRNEGDIVYEGLKNKKRSLSMDFSKWRSSSLVLFTSINNIVFTYALDYYLIGLFVFCIISSSFYNVFILMFITIFTTMQMIPSLKKYSMKEWGKITISTCMNSCNAIIFVIIGWYTLAAFLRPILTKAVQSGLLENSMVSYLWIIIANCLLSDLVKADDYVNNNSRMNACKDIQTKFITLYQAYLQNESVIYERVKLINKISELSQIENKFWNDRNNWGHLKFDPKYWHHSLEDTLEEKEEELKSRYLSSWTRFTSKIAEIVYSYCHRKTSDALFEDSTYVMMKVIQKNLEVLDGEVLDIEGLFGGDVSRYTELYTKISSFYHYLRNKAASQNMIYKRSYDELIKLESGKWRTVQKVFKINRKGSNRKRIELTAEKTKKIANIIMEAISNGSCKPTNYENEKASNNSNHDLETMTCDFGEYRIKFHNLTSKLIHKSRGYQVMKFDIFFQILAKFIISRIEYIVAMFIVMAQTYKGGAENILILGLILFGILIETHHGHAKLWSVIYFIYLSKGTISYMAENYKEIFGFAPEAFKYTSFITGNHSYITDSMILVSVFSLIQVLTMRGFSGAYLITFEDVGTALARVCLFNIALY